MTTIREEMAAAVETERSELLRMVRPRALTAAEHKELLAVVGDLLDVCRERRTKTEEQRRLLRHRQAKLDEATRSVRAMLSGLLAVASADEKTLGELETT